MMKSNHGAKGIVAKSIKLPKFKYGKALPTFVFDFFTSFRLIAAFLIGFIVDEDFRPSDGQIKLIVDEMIDAIVPMGGQEHHDRYGFTIILEGDNTRIEAMIDCYVMDMAWVKITLTNEGNTEELLICYTVFDDGDIQFTISYNGEDIVA